MVYSPRAEAALCLGTRSMALASLHQLNLSVRKRGAHAVGLPLSTGYLEKRNTINIPILSLKKCFKCIISLKISSVFHHV